MILNLFTGGINHTKIDKAEVHGDTFSVTPTTSQYIGSEIYPRIVNVVHGKDEIDYHVKLPKGLSARFNESHGQYFIEPVLLS